MNRFIVMTSVAAAPRGARAPYRNVAVVEVEPGCIPKMIRADAKGLVRIVRHYGAQFVGKTQACAYQRTLAEAEALATQLNHQAMAA